MCSVESMGDIDIDRHIHAGANVSLNGRNVLCTGWSMPSLAAGIGQEQAKGVCVLARAEILIWGNMGSDLG